jgi:hypothetical protein
MQNIVEITVENSAGDVLRISHEEASPSDGSVEWLQERIQKAANAAQAFFDDEETVDA